VVHPGLWPERSIVLVLAGSGAVTYDVGVLNELFAVALICALVFGVNDGSAHRRGDMPVVISLLNAFTGTAVSMPDSSSAT